MRELKIMNCNLPTLLDDEDYEKYKHIRWTCQHKKDGRKYVTHTVGGTTNTLRIHRLIMDAKPKEQVDHIDGNPLNNQRINLRLATNAQNCMNRKKFQNGRKMTSVYKGVYWDASTCIWRSGIRFNGKLINLGRWEDEREAAAIYNHHCKKIFGDFSLPNQGFSTEEEESAENKFLKRKSRNAKSRFLGVSKSQPNSKFPWGVHFEFGGKVITKGSFPTEEMAAREYDKIAKDVIGNSAILNYE